MKTEIHSFDGINIKTVTLDVAIIGTGAAGYNAAVQLKKLGVDDIAIITEGVDMGTSRNTGSDKQTYYKMNLCAADDDSPHSMASELFAGKCVDGDNALAEAANSVRCFLSLCELGVDFPVNNFGEYVGYKTDHDTRARATSVGPLTSKMMTECLQKEALRRDVTVFDKQQVIEIITDNNKVLGVLCLNLDGADDKNTRFTLFKAHDIIYATGGPAGIYSDTVYPVGHAGASGVAFLAGAKGQNLTEWQYGLASIAPRWNVSGTYMQVLPRFFSRDEQGNEYEFLSEYYSDDAKALSMVFKKGYEWPFDSRKAQNGSSVIDLLVYREVFMRGRRVFLDFTRNPFGLKEIPFGELSDEARDYLKNAGADFGTPIERLSHMNMPAVELYRSKGVDITSQPLEISLCAQHNNGGIAVDMWWQTDIKGLFAAGECAGTHGVYRPGGSALNAGQVGSLRAASYIAARPNEPSRDDEFFAAADKKLRFHIALCKKVLENGGDSAVMKLKKARKSMSECAGAIRSPKAIGEYADKVKEELVLLDNAGVSSPEALRMLYRLRDTLAAQYVYLTAFAGYSEKGGKSRGSALYTNENGVKPDGLEDIFRFIPDDGALDKRVEQVALEGNLKAFVGWRDVRALPDGGGFFENVWRGYRENRNVY